ncbi:MAG: 3-hydroxyacyl-CoA dehydrogenase, partial [Gemmatimonadales bacterium]|nr:3-hydroxyacyl-CoA dehydrogenase [Gemmatimonadales bacterium]
MVKRIAIVGAGTIGASWSAFYLASGFEVVITDPAPEAEVFVRDFIVRAWPSLQQLGAVA